MKEKSSANVDQIISYLRSLANPANLEGMARFGINTSNALGINIPVLRSYAKQFKKDNKLAAKLWKTKINEARFLAIYMSDPEQVTEKQMESWVKDFDSWDICDQCCGNLFDRTPFAYSKAIEWAQRKEEYVKRAGFVMMACLAVHDKKATDKQFYDFFSLIKKGASDERNFVKKAVNWALRQIGKRNEKLRKDAIKVARKIQTLDNKGAKWVAADALRELEKYSIR